jgi:hypothetical protein
MTLEPQLRRTKPIRAGAMLARIQVDSVEWGFLLSAKIQRRIVTGQIGSRKTSQAAKKRRSINNIRSCQISLLNIKMNFLDANLFCTRSFLRLEA